MGLKIPHSGNPYITIKQKSSAGDPESRYENVIKVNLADIYNGNGEKDIPLQNLDRVVIHANLNYFEKENIYISGEVNIPGAYPLVSDNETLQSVINRAGKSSLLKH